ncbi:MAG: carboxypeptidase-like regulatory domain-containing protein, partial [Anaerolineales bacterium]|nr:carboxypeptidase-like regulatory domain-containing protein [Anaerolineales bacterium]
MRGIVVALVGLAIALSLGCSPRAQRSAPAATLTPMAPSQAVTPALPEDTIRGTVVDARGAPMPSATVRAQATANSTRTDEAGRFLLAGLEAGVPVTISAWSQGYYCAKAIEVTPPAGGVTLVLRTIQTTDNTAYDWVPPVGENSCYSCKPGVTQVWLDSDAHGKSASNPRFLSMYSGTDVDGNRSPLTRYGYIRDYGRIPLLPDPSQPYFGPGYKLDFPQTAGNCAACHLPGPAVDAPYGVDPTTVSGVDALGIHCDFCHKIADVSLDLASGLPYPNMPGVLSMDIRRPFPGDPERYQLFFGTFDDDNVPLEDTYLPLIKKSQWCAACHQFSFWGTPIYQSF